MYWWNTVFGRLKKRILSQGSLNPKIRFLGQKMCYVVHLRTDTHTRKWLLWAPFQGFRSFSFNLSSRIGPKIVDFISRAFFCVVCLPVIGVLSHRKSQLRVWFDIWIVGTFFYVYDDVYNWPVYLTVDVSEASSTPSPQKSAIVKKCDPLDRGLRGRLKRTVSFSENITDVIEISDVLPSGRLNGEFWCMTDVRERES